MGKAKKAHRAKVAKRNAGITQKRKSFEKKIKQLQEMMRNGILNKGAEIINAEQAAIETGVSVETITDAEVIPTEQVNKPTDEKV